MFSALGCGGKAEDDARPAQPAFNAPPALPTSPPMASAPQRPQPAPLTQLNPEPRSRPPQAMPDYEGNSIQASAESILAANCGQCHGPALLPSQASAGVNFINDTDLLVEAGWIVPLSSATSPVVVVMRDGSMPPLESGLPAVTEADIDVVAVFIDNPRFWPDPSAGVDAGIETPPVDAGADGG